MYQSDLSGVRTEILARHFLAKRTRPKRGWNSATIQEERERDVRSFWDANKARRRHFVFEFNGCIYTAGAMVMQQTHARQYYGADGQYRSVIMEQPYRNDQCPISICSGYVPYDMLALHGVYGPAAQQRVANLTNYGEEHPALQAYEISLGGSEKASFYEGDICMMYGPPNAGKNAAADYIGSQLSSLGLKCCIVEGFETRAFSAKSISGWLSLLDQAADENDVIFCDGMTDLIVKGQVAKSSGGSDNEHAIEGPKWFSGLAAARKMVFWMANTMDQSDKKLLEARRTMYTGKFSSVIYSPGKSEGYVNTIERGSGFGKRVETKFSVSQAILDPKGYRLPRYTFDYSMSHRVDEMQKAMDTKVALKPRSHFDERNDEETY